MTTPSVIFLPQIFLPHLSPVRVVRSNYLLTVYCFSFVIFVLFVAEILVLESS